ncbi:MAG: hypothetical protein DBY38_12740 [Clostridium cadaveris]|uniref:Uncharacterized protein n=1 Tax=Clostridium cadaveris TaxID=1529 RepID=A0A316M0D1_9CLOT|nr:MAG: hypothetical protein DBY38_12740 [Clostridium cadaveris]
MGVTIRSKNKSIDLGYFGFRRLRIKVAELTNFEIEEHYRYLEQGTYIFNEKAREIFFKKYDSKIMELDKKYNYKYSSILNFLYSSDCEAVIEVDNCKDIYEIIKDYDDDVCYGYCGREDCAMFKDFKELVKDCVDNNEPMEWY